MDPELEMLVRTHICQLPDPFDKLYQPHCMRGSSSWATGSKGCRGTRAQVKCRMPVIPDEEPSALHMLHDSMRTQSTGGKKVGCHTESLMRSAAAIRGSDSNK